MAARNARAPGAPADKVEHSGPPRRPLAVPVQVSLLLGAAIVAAWPTLVGLESYWRAVRDYNHGYLVVLVVLAWLAANRRRLAALPARPSPVLLPLLAGLLFISLVAWRAESQMLAQLVWPPVLAVAVWAGCGPSVARAVAPALVYLYFATPIWDYLVPLLQWLTVEASERMLAVLGVPVSVDGNFITIRDGTFEVAEGCAGKRYFVVTLALAAALGVLDRFPPRRLLAFMALAAALAVLMNWIRVVVVVVVGHATAMQHYLVAVEHQSLGWAMFGLLLAFVLWLGHRLRPAGQGTKSLVAAGPPVAAGEGTRWWWPMPLLFATSAWHALTATSPAQIAPRLDNLPVLTGDWQGPFAMAGQWQPMYRGPAQEVRGAYRGGSGRVEVYVNVFGTQAPGRELVGSSNSLAGEGSKILQVAPVSERLASLLTGEPVFAAIGPPRGEAWIVGRLFRVGGISVGLELPAQVIYGTRSLGRPVPAGVIAFATPCEGDCGAARRRLEDFWRAVGPHLRDIIPADAARAAECSKLPDTQSVGEEC